MCFFDFNYDVYLFWVLLGLMFVLSCLLYFCLRVVSWVLWVLACFVCSLHILEFSLDG